MTDRISHHSRIGQSFSFWQENLYSKLIAVGIWELANLQFLYDET